MRKLSLFELIVTWFKSFFVDEKKAKENSDEAKRKMCERAVQGGVCPHECDICAWNTIK